MKSWNPDNHIAILRQTKDGEKASKDILSTPSPGLNAMQVFPHIPSRKSRILENRQDLSYWKCKNWIEKMNEFAKYQMAIKPGI